MHAACVVFVTLAPRVSRMCSLFARKKYKYVTISCPDQCLSIVACDVQILFMYASSLCMRYAWMCNLNEFIMLFKKYKWFAKWAAIETAIETKRDVYCIKCIAEIVCHFIRCSRSVHILRSPWKVFKTKIWVDNKINLDWNSMWHTHSSYKHSDLSRF